MATAVLDLDLERLPAGIDVDRHYGEALALLRFRGRPVGRVTLPVVDGHVAAATLNSAIPRDAIFWRAWLRDHLGIEKRAIQSEPATVAVCTRDRPDDIRRCLESIAAYVDDGHEVLVVDNCPSSDATENVVRTYPRVRYVREPRPGLNNARNRALREASHPIVAFTDDDAVPDRAWLDSLLRNFRHPLVMVVTGLTMPLELETEAQEWFERYGGFSRGFERRVFEMAYHNPFIGGPMGGGVNMAIRRSAPELIGPFDEALDAGTATKSGGDHEMFSRVLTRGYKLVYEPSALCWHRHRRTWEELRDALYGYGVGVYAYWTRALLVERELSVVWLALNWLIREQLPNLVRASWGDRKMPPVDLVWAELRGCAAGPRAYLRARRHASISMTSGCARTAA